MLKVLWVGNMGGREEIIRRQLKELGIEVCAVWSESSTGTHSGHKKMRSIPKEIDLVLLSTDRCAHATTTRTKNAAKVAEKRVVCVTQNFAQIVSILQRAGISLSPKR